VRAAVAFLTAAFGFVECTRIGDDHRVFGVPVCASDRHKWPSQ
jgi:hypothetical protein